FVGGLPTQGCTLGYQRRPPWGQSNGAEKWLAPIEPPKNGWLQSNGLRFGRNGKVWRRPGDGAGISDSV
ncbi:MAG: hypothetical protein EA381_19860, partial [Planctomycetaceae bacterium]